MIINAVGSGFETMAAPVTRMVAGVAEQVAGEIQRSLDFYLATSGEREVTRIYVSGGTANVAVTGYAALKSVWSS